MEPHECLARLFLSFCLFYKIHGWVNSSQRLPNRPHPCPDPKTVAARSFSVSFRNTRTLIVHLVSRREILPLFLLTMPVLLGERATCGRSHHAHVAPACSPPLACPAVLDVSLVGLKKGRALRRCANQYVSAFNGVCAACLRGRGELGGCRQERHGGHQPGPRLVIMWPRIAPCLPSLLSVMPRGRPDLLQVPLLTVPVATSGRVVGSCGTRTSHSQSNRHCYK